jgi:hypothetical protein
MPLIIAKLLSDDSVADLNTAVDAYKAVETELLLTQRAMASDVFIEADADRRRSVVLFHGGLDIPASGAATAALQHIIVDADGSIEELQAAIDAALALVEHSSITNADLDSTPGDIITITSLFAAEDVGRQVEIAGELREITAYTAATQVTYDGVALTGTNQTVKLLGAEVIQDAHMTMKKDKAAGGHRLNMLMALEGEAY